MAHAEFKLAARDKLDRIEALKNMELQKEKEKAETSETI